MNADYEYDDSTGAILKVCPVCGSVIEEANNCSSCGFEAVDSVTEYDQSIAQSGDINDLDIEDILDAAERSRSFLRNQILRRHNFDEYQERSMKEMIDGTSTKFVRSETRRMRVWLFLLLGLITLCAIVVITMLSMHTTITSWLGG